MFAHTYPSLVIGQILTVGFVALTAAAAINLLTDSVFIASRRAGLCALTDGGFGGLSKISFGLLFAGGGAYGLFCAAGCGFATAAVVSVILIATTLHWRPSVREPFRALKPLLRVSSANYLRERPQPIPQRRRSYHCVGPTWREVGGILFRRLPNCGATLRCRAGGDRAGFPVRGVASGRGLAQNSESQPPFGDHSVRTWLCCPCGDRALGAFVFRWSL